MTQQQSKRQTRRGRIFPALTISPEERTKKEADIKAFCQRCRPIFKRLRTELIKDRYNRFIVIEPESEHYFIAQCSGCGVDLSKIFVVMVAGERARTSQKRSSLGEIV
ncbi:MULTISPECIES: hypothetical protein [Cyanophyceae]|uniref:hypothetical protein n=1 Tax=Cyanophyceae TaxID=3028117 RepID=UPI001684DEA7|nr:hypothetical protein [Trichocoleus sp. FACHB-69]MBD1933528.1 hypothetical protein [Trichocoleus sp. FACHB-69]